MTSDMKEMENPPHWEWVRRWLIAASICGSLIALIFIPIGKYLAVAGGIGALLFLLLGIWLREYYRRPNKVRIEQSGIWVFFRYKREVFIPWQEVRWLSAPPGDPKKLGLYRDGYMQLQSSKVFYPLHWPVAIAVREAYREQNGHYPPFRESDVAKRQF
jgi:hypothetical protein